MATSNGGKIMKKRQIFTIAACAIAALFFTGVLVAGLRGNPADSLPSADAPRTHTNSKLIDLEEYSIDSVDVSWLSGPVTVGPSPDGQIHITERSSSKLGEAERMKVDINSSTLTIRWDSQWFRRFFNVNLGWFGQLDKELEVLLPSTLALDTLDVSNTSNELSVTGLMAQTLDLSSVSGAITVTSCTADALEAETVSGNLALEDSTGAESVSVNTVSGGMELTDLSAGELSLDTVSGACKLTGQADELTVSTISGDIAASLKANPKEVDMDSVSGALKLELPPTSGFTVEYDSVSGNFTCGFSTEDLGGHRLRCGDGGADIRMNTTSGSMDIQKRGI